MDAFDLEFVKRKSKVNAAVINLSGFFKGTLSGVMTNKEGKDYDPFIACIVTTDLKEYEAAVKAVRDLKDKDNA